MPREEGNVRSWASHVDAKTMEQARRSASLAIVAGPVALMPDAHLGYGATVGSVIPTEGAVIPSAVGVDIGCGMIAAQLDAPAGTGRPMTAADLPDDLRPMHSAIAAAIPSGVGKGHDARSAEHQVALRRHLPELPPTKASWKHNWERKAHDQLGSLGSGNHFVEVCLDEDDAVWLVLHSGSRGIGNLVANMHIDRAKADMKRRLVELPDRDLAYVVEGTAEFEAYITDMLWAQDYAMANRQVMLEAALDAIGRVLGRRVRAVETINCHHNFTEREPHGGRELWITRKGAIRARAGDRGVIPGSMGTRSYIVRGLGNPASYESCSHGAGRAMSRNAARRTLDEDSFRALMNGITWNETARALIDEDPRAYKDIDEVMEHQRDLVETEHVLNQVLNYKGT